MTCKIEPEQWACSLKVFEINDVRADERDFGQTVDLAPYDAPEYGCGDRSFVPFEARQSVLDKYSITESEYEKIAEELKTALHFGRCGLCA